TAEVACPDRALGSRLSRLDPGGESGGIELVARRREDGVDALRLCDLEVALLVTWIRGEIFRLVELRRVDEQRCHHAVVLGPRCPEERAVTLVQRYQRRHEARARCRLELRDRAEDPHESSTVASASVS